MELRMMTATVGQEGKVKPPGVPRYTCAHHSLRLCELAVCLCVNAHSHLFFYPISISSAFPCPQADLDAPWGGTAPVPWEAQVQPCGSPVGLELQGEDNLSPSQLNPQHPLVSGTCQHIVGAYC